MADSFGPRTYLVGQILNGLTMTGSNLVASDPKSLADAVVRLADAVLDRLQTSSKP